MLTLRHLPTLAENHPNDVLRYYYRGLLQHWNSADRALGRILNLYETGFGAPAERRALGISRSEWSLAEGRVDQQQMLTMRARKGVHRLVNAASIPLGSSVLKNKQSFDEFARRAKLPIPDAFYASTEALSIFLDRHAEIIVKPNFSSKGKGVERSHHGSSGHDLAHIEAQLKKGALLQEAIATHPAVAPISPNALSTMRVVTMLNETGDTEIVARILRVGGGKHPVDNFNRGGLAAMVAEGGALGTFFRHDSGLPPSAVAVHPSSNVPLPRTLPSDLATDVDQLALHAHRAMVPDHTIVGWDIGLGENGAVLIEGNWNPGTNVTQLLGGQSVCTGRSGELYLLALKKVPDTLWKNARPVQNDGSR